MEFFVLQLLKKQPEPEVHGVLSQRSRSLGVMSSLLAVLRIALFWTVITDVDPGTCWSHSPNLGILSCQLYYIVINFHYDMITKA